MNEFVGRMSLGMGHIDPRGQAGAHKKAQTPLLTTRKVRVNSAEWEGRKRQEEA